MRLLLPQWLWMLTLLLPLLGTALLALWLNRRSKRRMFGSALRWPWTGAARPLRFWLRTAAMLVAFASVGLALARPAHSPEPKPVQRPAREVVFVIDVSRSMLAQDIRPNRLDRAKLAVSDAMETVRGERIGIVAFAGTASVKCPLTTDVGFAQLALEALSTDSVGRGGTAIGEAIGTALELLGVEENAAKAVDQTEAFRDIVLITDGEDHESGGLAAANAAAEAGVRIIALGLGSELSGATIPAQEAGSTQQYQGRPISTRQNAESLRAIAQATPGGVFFNVGTGSIEMDRVYERLMRDRSRTQTDASPAVRWTESFQWPLGLALLCLCVEPLLGVFWTRGRNA